MSKELYLQYEVTGYIPSPVVGGIDSYITKSVIYGTEIETRTATTLWLDQYNSVGFQTRTLVNMSFLKPENFDLAWSNDLPIGYEFWYIYPVKVSDDFTIPDEYNHASQPAIAPFFDSFSDNTHVQSQPITFDDSLGNYLTAGVQYAKDSFIGLLEDTGLTIVENIADKYGVGSYLEMVNNALTVRDVLKNVIDGGVDTLVNLLNNGDNMTPAEIDAAVDEYINGAMRTTLIGLNDIIGTPDSEVFDTIHNVGGNILLATQIVGSYNTNNANQRTEFIAFSDGTDTITQSTGNSFVILGGSSSSNHSLSSANDIYFGGFGSDTVKGELGNDYINGGDSLDNLQGGSGNDYIKGGNGNDILTGGSGADILIGDSGSDILTGGAGRDSFRLLDFSKDKIKDFSVIDDTIQLENSVFTKLTITGTLNSAYFKIGTVAADNNDYIVYNKITGALFYDDDGNGSHAAVQIAQLGVNLPITNADFVVI